MKLALEYGLPFVSVTVQMDFLLGIGAHLDFRRLELQTPGQ